MVNPTCRLTKCEKYSPAIIFAAVTFFANSKRYIEFFDSSSMNGINISGAISSIGAFEVGYNMDVNYRRTNLLSLLITTTVILPMAYRILANDTKMVMTGYYRLFTVQVLCWSSCESIIEFRNLISQLIFPRNAGHQYRNADVRPQHRKIDVVIPKKILKPKKPKEENKKVVYEDPIEPGLPKPIPDPYPEGSVMADLRARSQRYAQEPPTVYPPIGPEPTTPYRNIWGCIGRDED